MKSRFPFPRATTCALLFIALATNTLRAGPALYSPAGEPHAAKILAPPPEPGSAEQAVDMSAVQAVFHATTSNEAAIAFSEKKFSVYTFGSVVGPFFQSNSLPKTTAFFERVQTNAEIVTDTGKEFFKRPRPFTLDPSLASGTLEKSYSYPSGHSTESMVLDLVLAEVFPDKQDAIIAKARDIGWHRVEIARHYPTDIHAGRMLAQAIVRDLDASQEFQKDLAAVRREVASVQQAAKKNAEPATAAAHQSNQKLPQ